MNRPRVSYLEPDCAAWVRIVRSLPAADALARAIAAENAACVVPPIDAIARRRAQLGAVRRSRVELGLEDLALAPEWRQGRAGRELLVLAASLWIPRFRVPEIRCDVLSAYGVWPTVGAPEDVCASMHAWLDHIQALARPADRYVLLLVISTRFLLPARDGNPEGWEGHQLTLVLRPTAAARFRFTAIDTVSRQTYVWPLVDWMADALGRRVEIARVKHVFNGLGAHSAPDSCVLRSFRAVQCLLHLQRPLERIGRMEPPDETARFDGFIELLLLRMRRLLLSDPLIWHPTAPRAVVLAHTVLGHGAIPPAPRLWLVRAYWFRKLLDEPSRALTMARMARAGTRHWQAATFVEAEADVLHLRLESPASAPNDRRRAPDAH